MFSVTKDIDIATEFAGYSNKLLSIVKGWKIERLFKTGVNVLNFFCLAPFTVHPDGGLSLNRTKFILFPCLLAVIMYFELSNILFMMRPPPEERKTKNMMGMIFTGRSVFQSVFLIASVASSTLLTPKYLVKCYNLCRQLDRALPVTFPAKKLLILLLCLLVLGGLEGWIFCNFRYPGGIAPGPLLIAILGTLSCTYLHYVTFASDITFCLLSMLNHKYHQEILECLKGNEKDKHTLFYR